MPQQSARVRFLQGMSLRARLVTGLIAVVLVGLMAANVIVFENIESFLIRGIDAQLVTARVSVNNALSPSRFGAVEFPSSTPAGTYGAAYTTAGVEEVSIQGFSGPKPMLSPSTLERLASGGSGNGQNFTYLTVGSVGNPSFQYRVIGYPVNIVSANFSLSTPGVAVVAIPLTSMNATLHQLILVDLIVGALLLVLLGLLGYLVVRVGLRPLGDIEETAGAIAAGDLSRRVDRVEPTTEVGRLGVSLNVMLETIEHSFNEQLASENRLRQFLADASHELRTPVTSIRGYAELFRRGAAERPDDLATAMRRIEDESIRMGSLVDDLLLLARLDQGRPLEEVPVDLAVVAGDSARDAEVLAPDREVVLQVAGPLIVLGDESRLRQVVGNLLQNALRHTPAGAKVTIIAGRRGADVFLSVADEGPGIPPEHLPHLFERFYRADPSRTRMSGGAGLGLAIVASIVDSLGGTATVVSDLGHGATFTISLPSLLASSSATNAPESTAEAPPAPLSSEATPSL